MVSLLNGDADRDAIGGEEMKGIDPVCACVSLCVYVCLFLGLMCDWWRRDEKE